LEGGWGIQCRTAQLRAGDGQPGRNPLLPMVGWTTIGGCRMKPTSPYPHGWAVRSTMCTARSIAAVREELVSANGTHVSIWRADGGLEHTPKRAATSYLDGGTSQTGRVTVDPLHRWRRAPQPPQQRSHGGYSRTRTGLRPDGPASTCGAWFSGDSKGTRYQGSASRAPHLQCSGYARSLPFGSAA
jgi:hypothetical protein